MSLVLIRFHISTGAFVQLQINFSFAAGSSYGNESIEMSPSLKNNVSIDSKLLRASDDPLETTVSKIISSEGGFLNLDKCGVSLFVPEGAIDKDERELFSIEVTDEEWNRPILQEGTYYDHFK